LRAKRKIASTRRPKVKRTRGVELYDGGKKMVGGLNAGTEMGTYTCQQGVGNNFVLPERGWTGNTPRRQIGECAKGGFTLKGSNLGE